MFESIMKYKTFWMCFVIIFTIMIAESAIMIMCGTVIGVSSYFAGISIHEMEKLAISMGSIMTPLLIGPVVEEIAKKFAISKGLAKFPLVFGLVEGIWYFVLLVLAGLPVLIAITIRIPPIIMHWWTGRIIQNGKKDALLQAIATHSLFNLIAPKIWNCIF